MSELLLFHCTAGADEPERATVPLIAASVAAASGQRATVVCTLDAVWFGTPDGAEGVTAPQMPPLSDLVDAFLASGGELWLCSACTTPRDIDEGDLREGAVIVGAARIVEAIIAGARSITLT
ncbi:MAG: DsrE family protein [Actinobacteria bacterium]|nr:DsrE family protein [Actinomycetota bacterium]